MNETTEEVSDSIDNPPTSTPSQSHSPPHLAPQQNSLETPQRINKRYLMSVFCILRIALILFQLASWISAAAVLSPTKSDTMPTKIAVSRGVFISFSVVGWLKAIIIFLLQAINIKSSKFSKRRLDIITLITNLIWVIPTFVLAILAGLKETEIATFTNNNCCNRGAFGAASFFGFVCSLAYAIDSQMAHNSMLWVFLNNFLSSTI